MSAPPFLARRAYRARRLADAARMAPLLGTLLMMAPLLLGGTPSAARVGLYLFAVWAGLILATRLLARALARAPDAAGEEGGA